MGDTLEMNFVLYPSYPNDLQTIGNMLLCESDYDDEEHIVLYESDTNKEEYLSKKKAIRNQLSVASYSENEDNNNGSSTEAYEAHLKKNRNTIDSWLSHKKLFKKTNSNSSQYMYVCS